MCGIAGTMGAADERIIRRMTDSLAHRGPDDQGVRLWPEIPAAFGHRRLSIIDLSDAAHQPLGTADERYWITFNGEIYNHAELRQELSRRGITCHSRSDTEVVLAAYALWGAACLERLRGMFAFAILDTRTQTLFLARDRFGIKPLYYTTFPGDFAFASELRAFLAANLVSRQADRQAIWDYLSLGSVAPPRTILAGVHVLPPGHWMQVSCKGEILQTCRYWDLVQASAVQRERLGSVGFADAAAALREQLDTAARYHVVADVPVGAFLSGGVDSAAMVALMSRHVSYPIQTFTVGFEQRHRDLSETALARETAAHFGTEHHEVTITDAEAALRFPAIVDALDQPSMDGANTYFVSRSAGGAVKVALSGLGGDELFAGYPHFRRHLRAVHWRRRLGSGAVGWLRMLPNRFRHNVMLPALDAAARAETLRCQAYEDDKRRMVTPGFLDGWEPLPLRRLYEESVARVAEPVQQLSLLELTGYMCRTLLRDGDAMSMAHSLEVRPILLDHPLAEFAFALPWAYKLQGDRGKAIFLEALADMIPPFVRSRPKRGFELPLLRWLSGPLLSDARAVFAGRHAGTLFRQSFLRRVQGKLASPTARDFPLWSVFVLLRWLEAADVEL